MEFRSDHAQIKEWKITGEGYLQFLAPIAREGYLLYRDGSGTRKEFVSAQTLKKTAHSFAKKPITIEHPPTLLTAKNAKQYAVGWTANEARLGEDGLLWLSGTVFDSEAIAAIQSGEAKEISCGYSAKIVDRGDGTFEQVSRHGNHIAAVPRGRAGSDVSFRLDSGEEILISQGSEAAPPLVQAFNFRPRKEKMYTAHLDGIPMEVNSLDEVKHVKAMDAELTKLRTGSEKASEQMRADSETIAGLNNRIAELTAELSASQLNIDSIQKKFDALVSDRDSDSESRQDSAVDVEAILAKHLPERMALWNEVLPAFHADAGDDFKPDYLMTPVEIKVAYLRHTRPDLSDRLDSLDMSEERAIGAIDGMYAAFSPQLNNRQSAKSANRVDALLATIRGDRSEEVENLDNLPSLEKIRSAYENAYRGGL